jgi:hypothetical protein
LAFTEPNGAVIAQFNSGYDAFLANKWGGYRHPLGTDLRAAPSYLQDAVGNFNFLLRIPIEISPREALGALPNQNAAASFKFRYTLGSGAAGGPLYSAITLQPTVRVRFYLEAWDQPELQSSGGANQVTPPAMNTTQFWTPQIINVSAGQQTIKLTRVGNYLRSLILQYRRAGTSRANGELDFPDPMTLFLDARPIDIVEKNNFLHQMYERTGYGGRAAAVLITVFVSTTSAMNSIRVWVERLGTFGFLLFLPLDSKFRDRSLTLACSLSLPMTWLSLALSLSKESKIWVRCTVMFSLLEWFTH